MYPERQPPAPRVSNSSTWRDSLLVFLLAILIRILTTSTLLFVPQTLPAFDKSADDLLPSSDRWIQGFLRWDALYFTQIAQNGYTREQEFAFMPGLPYLMRLLGMMSEETTTPSVKAMVLTTSVLANIAAVVAAILFHRCANLYSCLAPPAFLKCWSAVCLFDFYETLVSP